MSWHQLVFLILLVNSESTNYIPGWISNTNLSLLNIPYSTTMSVAGYDNNSYPPRIWILTNATIISLQMNNFAWIWQTDDTIINSMRLPVSDIFQNTIYYMSQRSDGSTQSILWQFSMATHTLSVIQSLPPIDASLCIDKKRKLIFIVGGLQYLYLNWAFLSSVSVYDIENHQMLNAVNITLQQPRYKHLCKIIDDELYIFGGNDKYYNLLSSIEKLHIYAYSNKILKTDAIFTVLDSSLSTPRIEHQLVQGIVNQQLIYIIGGIGSDSMPLDSVEIFDTDSEKVFLGERLPQSRTLFSVARTDTDIYIFGGCCCGIDPTNCIDTMTWYRSLYVFPTLSPTLDPLKSVSLSPIKSPTLDPLKSVFPTLPPTIYTTQSSSTSNNNANDGNISYTLQDLDLNDWFFLGLFVLFLVVMVMTFIGYYQSKKKKYRFQVFYFVKFFYNLYDFITDIMVAMNIMNKLNDGVDVNYLIMCIILILSIIVPSILNIFQLNKYIKNWIKTDGTTTVWLSHYSYSLYLSSIIIGNNEVTVKFFSCNFFKMDVFCLNLKHSKMMELQNGQYIINFMENIPQFIIEIWYLIYSHSYYDIVLLSMIFNLLSMVVTIFTCNTQRAILRQGVTQNNVENLEMLNTNSAE